MSRFITITAAVAFLASLLDGHRSQAHVRAGPEFQVNTYTWSRQLRPSVASDTRGNFVVAWESTGQIVGGGADIFGQRFNAFGAPVGAEFLVNLNTAANERGPSLASAPNGGFVVTWSRLSSLSLFGQRFSSTGTRLNGEFPKEPPRLHISLHGTRRGAEIPAQSCRPGTGPSGGFGG